MTAPSLRRIGRSFLWLAAALACVVVVVVFRESILGVGGDKPHPVWPQHHEIEFTIMVVAYLCAAAAFGASIAVFLWDDARYFWLWSIFGGLQIAFYIAF